MPRRRRRAGCGGRCQEVAELLGAAAQDLIAFDAFPPAHWSELPQRQSPRRFYREIGRRTGVIGVFPDDRSPIRLMELLCLEQNDEWAGRSPGPVGRRDSGRSGQAPERDRAAEPAHRRCCLKRAGRQCARVMLRKRPASLVAAAAISRYSRGTGGCRTVRISAGGCRPASASRCRHFGSAQRIRKRRGTAMVRKRSPAAQFGRGVLSAASGPWPSTWHAATIRSRSEGSPTGRCGRRRGPCHLAG